ncbi:MAG TPA: NAD(P)/FAD-dependent oxidoreductase [Candidatus Dormibacteraeota bacterium]|nr:NAD(P)/FAD-dependent oxidoreductase [Candidatus Dormibacteraeota bacterium]
MRSVDAVIIGGGPAGSTAAWALRRQGADVLVWDRKPFPRDKICAGWITPHVVAALQLDLDEYAAGGRTCQPIRGFQVSRQGDREARVRYPDVVSYGIRRCEFDHYLLSRSAARQRLGEPVRSLVRRDGAWIVNDEVRAPVILGAGGHFCPLAQQLGARLGHGEPVIAAQEAEFAIPAGRGDYRIEPDLPEIFFTRDLRGYGWVFRKGDHINIGLGRQGNEKLAEHVTDFVAWLAARGTVPATLGGKLRGHPYLLYGQAPRPLSGEGALLIGDAAGLAYPKSGEGIRPAVESALLAAHTVAGAGGRLDAAARGGYERAVVERFGPRQSSPTVLDLIPAWMLAGLAGRLFGRPWFARRVVLDDWFFHASQAPLAAQ